MSRIGKRSISLDSGVDVKQEGNIVAVKGPKGQISLPIGAGFEISIEANTLQLKPRTEDKKNKSAALYGLYGALIRNAVIGVTKEFTITLVLVGVGSKVQLQGKKLVFALGYSHPVEVEAPEYVKVECPDQTTIVLRSIYKDKLGQFAAYIKSLRKVEPYKGKGIRNLGQVVKLKAGKTGKK